MWIAVRRRQGTARAAEAQGEAVEFVRNGVLYLSSEGGKKEDPATIAS